MLVVVDGDTVAYRAAFAAQHSVYTLLSAEDGMPIREFRYKKEIDQFLEDTEEDYDWERETRLEPVSHALQNCKSILLNIEKACRDKFSKEPEVLVYLSGDDNFRKHVATFEPYKGNRTEDKPVHLAALREYMEQYWGATNEPNIEADDLMSITSANQGYDNVVLVTTDKDLNQVPGWHYNFVKSSFTYLPQLTAEKFFWSQMIEGDSADNIKGISGAGPKFSYRLLDGLRNTDAFRQSVYGAYVDKYGEGEGHARFVETYALLRLLRSNEEIQRVRENVKS